jgi:hypothetical protein
MSKTKKKNKVEETVLLETNKYQTPITAELKASLDPEVYANLIDFITRVKFVANLIDPKRKRVSQLKKKNKRVIVDVANPHILTNMEFFIKDRIHFEKYGYYTAAKFSRNPHSAYRKYWDEQERRAVKGYTRPDGEWIPGYLYWYWNFSPIQITDPTAEVVLGKKVRSDRIEKFPDIWEIDYFYFHYIDQAEDAGAFAVLLKCRGMGASFKSASQTSRNFFLLRKSKSYVTASFDGYLYEDGIMNKVQDMEAFGQINTAFKKMKITSNLSHFESGYRDKAANNAKRGYRSEIIGLNTKEPNNLRGKRGKLIIHEEAGSNRRLIDAWRVATRSLDDRGNVFGLQLAQGTGGDEQSDFVGLTQLFFKPKAFDIYHVTNVFDKNSINSQSGFFMGDYMNRPRSYNKDGVTDVVMNLIHIFEERKNLESELDDPDAIAKKKAETAITPLEAITIMSDNVFPKEAAKEAIAELSANYAERTKGFHHCRLNRKWVGDKFVVNLVHSSDYFPITEYPYTGKQAHRGAVTIKKMPATMGDGEIPHYRYIAGIDTLDDDDTTGSLFKISVMDLWTDDIVAWYLGRHVMIEEDYEIALNLCILFNATANYESNFKGLYGHFKNKNALRYLADTPKILAEKELIKGKGSRVGNASKGTRATAPINAWGRRLQAGFMRKQHVYYTDKTGIETIDDLEYLREVSMFDPLGNYDSVSAGNMLFIYRADLVRVVESGKFQESEHYDYNDDTFFDDSRSSIVVVTPQGKKVGAPKREKFGHYNIGEEELNEF